MQIETVTGRVGVKDRKLDHRVKGSAVVKSLDRKTYQRKVY